MSFSTPQNPPRSILLKFAGRLGGNDPAPKPNPPYKWPGIRIHKYDLQAMPWETGGKYYHYLCRYCGKVLITTKSNLILPLWQGWCCKGHNASVIDLVLGCNCNGDDYPYFHRMEKRIQKTIGYRGIGKIDE